MEMPVNFPAKLANQIIVKVPTAKNTETKNQYGLHAALSNLAQINQSRKSRDEHGAHFPLAHPICMTHSISSFLSTSSSVIISRS